MNNFNNQDDSQNPPRFASRRLEKLPRSSFSHRQRIERNRQQVRAYKESIVARNDDGRRAAAEFEKAEKDIEAMPNILPSAQDEATHYNRSLPPSNQRPTPPPPNRFIKPPSTGRFG